VNDPSTAETLPAPRNIRLIGDIVVVVKDEPPEMIGRIVVPPSAREAMKQKWHRCKVLGVGPGRWVHCSSCVLGWTVECSMSPFEGDSLDVTVRAPALDRAGLSVPVTHRFQHEAMDLLRCRAREVEEEYARALAEAETSEVSQWAMLRLATPLPPRNCSRCIGDRPGWVLFRRQPVRAGDVVYVQESVSGKRVSGPVVRELFGVDEAVSVPSKACALVEA
jgi:hypothetical protein